MLNLPRFLKRYIRKHTRPKEPVPAFIKRSKISFVYAFLTWNLLGFIVYKAKVDNWFLDEDRKHLSDGRYFAEKLGKDDVILARFSGFTKVGQWDLRAEKAEHGRLLGEEELKDLEKRKQQQEEQQQQPEQQEEQELY